MSPTELTFAALDTKIESLPEFPSGSVVSTRISRWGVVAVVVGFITSLIAVKLLPSETVFTLPLASIGLVVEILGFLLACFPLSTKRLPTFSRDRHTFAEQLDFDMPHHQALVDWLRRFPREQREKLRDFASHRHQRMKEKLPMLTGSIDKLGALPIITALFLQFKDMQWPPHPSKVEICLIAILFLGYWLSLLQISARLRLQLYETVLNESLA